MEKTQHLTPYWQKMAVLNGQKAATFNEAERTVEFYAAVWNEKDDGGDILYRGCCSKSISEHGPNSDSPQKILMLAYHELNRPIGKLLSIEEDDYGLLCKARISDTQDGNEVIQLIKDGVINQYSIGFMYDWKKVRYEEEEGTWHVYEIRLFEVSAVSIGMNEHTHTKSAEEEAEDVRQRTEALIKSLSPSIGLEIRQLMTKWYTLGSKQPKKSLQTPEQPDTSSQFIDTLKEIKSIIKN